MRFLEPLVSSSRRLVSHLCVALLIVRIQWNAQWILIGVSDQLGCLHTWNLSETSWDALEIISHTTGICPLRSHRLHHTKHLPIHIKDPWIYEVSIPLHVHPLKTIDNKIHQTRHCIVSHQHFSQPITALADTVET